jgi:CheY-like chemotaxis protein
MKPNSLRILIVDDDADNARMLKVLLQMEGHDAGIANDGPSAIAAVNRQQPDVVLLDLGLPGMSGIDVAAELRRDHERSPGVLVALTGHGEERMPSPSPFDRYFAKPVNFDSLRAYLKEVWTRRQPSTCTPAVA